MRSQLDILPTNLIVSAGTGDNIRMRLPDSKVFICNYADWPRKRWKEHGEKIDQFHREKYDNEWNAGRDILNALINYENENNLDSSFDKVVDPDPKGQLELF